MEEPVRIEREDGKAIYGLLREVPDAPIVVSLHGITGHMNQHLHYLAARRFEWAKLTSFRFDFYGEEGDARRLIDCTPQLHADDIDAVIAYLSDRFPSKRIALVGH